MSLNLKIQLSDIKNFCLLLSIVALFLLFYSKL
jgi:hypothetical protein